MAKKLLLTITLMAVMSTSFSRELPEWLALGLKSPTPNQLAYWVDIASDCEITEDEAISLVDGVLIRSRIKPLSQSLGREASLYLNIRLYCLPVESRNPIFQIAINFARWTPYPPILYENTYRNLGYGDKEFVSQALKETIEDAITDFIKVNFDL
jgi:hypothetical protein